MQYVPGQSDTVWTFGCSAGVDVATSIGENSSRFPSYAAIPNPKRARWVHRLRLRRSPTPAIRLGRPRTGGRRATRGRAQVETGSSPPRYRLAGATVGVGRLLWTSVGAASRAPPGGAPRGRSRSERRAARGRFTGASTGRRRVRVTVRRVDRRGRARLTLDLGAAAFRAPRACHALPATVAIDTPPFTLDDGLAIRAGRIRHRLRIEHHVAACATRMAMSTGSRSYATAATARRGLAMWLHGPDRVQPGTSARYVAVLRNHGRGGWAGVVAVAIALNTGTRTTRIRELRRGRVRRMSSPTVPAAARTPLCDGSSPPPRAPARAAPVPCEGWRRARAGGHRLTRSHDKRRPFDALASRSACRIAPMSDEFARSGRSLAP